MELKEIVKLAKITANANPSAPAAYAYGEEKYSYAELNEVLRNELNTLAGNGDMLVYTQNKPAIFTIIREVIDEVLPKKVLAQYGMFADVKTYAQGDKPTFNIKISETSRKRAKQFVTKVGLAGRYEVFKLEGRTITIDTTAYGGAAQIGFEEFLDGRVDFADLLEVIMEGLDEAVYKEIVNALAAVVTNLPNNRASASSIVETTFDKLLSIADSYGKSTIFCTLEFAAGLVPSTGWVSDEMRNERFSNGYLGNYKGHRVVVLDQSYEDDAVKGINGVKVIDPSKAYIIPVGQEKPVKIAFEGQTQVRDYENRDWSREVQVYKKMGVGLIEMNGICVYTNTSLTK